MAVAISPKDNVEFITKADLLRPVEERTVFLIRPLTNVQRKLIEDQSLTMEQSSGTIRPRVGSVKIDTLRAGLTGWRNYKDEDGDEVAFENEGRKLSILGTNVDPPSWRSINRLDPNDLEEIFDAIMRNARTTVDEGKGLSSPQT